jgi:Putative MetA-pathway of phenol degradation
MDSPSSQINQRCPISSFWKVGVNDRFELRMITEPELLFGGGTNFALAPLKFGFKSRLIDGDGLLPNVSFIGHLAVPHLSTDNSRASNYNPDFRFTLDNSLSKKMSIGYNIGMRWDDGNPDPIFQYTCALGYELGKKWKCYVELYGDKAQNGAFELATSAGIYYYLKPNIMFDFTPSVGLVNSNLKHYFGLGFSFLIPTCLARDRVKSEKKSNE